MAAPTILVMGDSLSAAHGIPLDQGWVALLQKRLENRGYPYAVVNASISGETTAGALARLPDVLSKYRPTIVIIELGGNDGLRGISVDEFRSNLTRMIEQSKQAGARVLLTGIRLPPNYGPDYTRDFFDVYAQLADKYGVALVPFFMQDVATRPDLMQSDELHPNAKGQPRLLDNTWPYLEPLLKAVSQPRAGADGSR